MPSKVLLKELKFLNKEAFLFFQITIIRELDVKKVKIWTLSLKKSQLIVNKFII